jgi:hypothetical protein
LERDCPSNPICWTDNLHDMVMMDIIISGSVKLQHSFDGLHVHSIILVNTLFKRTAVYHKFALTI